MTYRSAAPRIPKLRTVERWNKNERTRDKETLMITARLLKSENAAIEKRVTIVRTNEKQQIIETRVTRFQRVLNRVERIKRYPYTILLRHTSYMPR